MSCVRRLRQRSTVAAVVSATTLKGILALAAAIALARVLIVLYRRRRTVGSALLLLGVACFVVVAVAHVFEAFALLPALGWGQSYSLGHYIDLAAAALGVVLVSVGLLVSIAQRTPRANTQ